MWTRKLLPEKEKNNRFKLSQQLKNESKDK